MKRRVKGKETEPPATIQIHKSTILRFSFFGPRLSADSSCGEFVDGLIAVCRGEPEFLRPESCRRYLALLPEFKNVVFEFHPSKPVAVVDQPIRQISPVLHEWIRSYLYRPADRHPILPSYSLDAAMFINSMLHGGYMGPNRHPENQGLTIEIEPLVRDAAEIRFEFDSSHKREFTNPNRLQYVLCRIPRDGQLRFNYSDKRERILGPGEEFEFLTGRCYLSADWGGAEPVITGEEPHRPDLQSEFKFPGRLEGLPDPLNLPSSFAYALYQAEIPTHWVIAALDHQRNRLPVPFGEPSKGPNPTAVPEGYLQ